MLIMKASDTKNESFRLDRANGPHCTHQATNVKMISAAVAVSRGPRRSAAHITGRTTKKPSAS
jgi:hypothetical protein